MQKIEIGSRQLLPQPDMLMISHHQRRERKRGAGAFTKTLLIVKLTIFLLTAALLNVHANSKAQSVTLSGKDITLKQVFAAIEKQTDYVAFYNQQILTNTKTVSLTVYNMPLIELLKIVLKDQPLDFTIEGKTIILSRKKQEMPTPQPADSITLASELLGPPIRGRVIGVDGQPLAGVTISIKGTNKGTNTISNGQFGLDLNEGDILEISYVGYTPITLSYTGNTFQVVNKETTAGKKQRSPENENNTSKLLSASQNSLLIQLARSNSPLEEVQITAYGKTSVRLATGNINTIKAEEIERQPVLTIQQALIGRVPGLTVTPVSGNPSAPVRLNIRGTNTLSATANTDPLYVIDGVPMVNLNASPSTGMLPISMGNVQGGRPYNGGENMLLGINPRDVESISVLKDADATAIYGSRGANGVILITTKKPKNGPASLSVSVNQGIDLLEKFPRLLNTSEYLAMRREAFRNDGITVTPDLNDAIDLTRWDTTKFTDWQRVFVGTGSSTALNARVSGGVAQTRYSIAAGFTSLKPLMNNGGKNQVGTLQTQLEHTSVNQKFSFSFSNMLALTEVVTSGLGGLSNQPPNAPDIYNEKGELNFAPYRFLNSSSYPFAALKKYSESNSFSLNSNINLRYEIVRGLTISALGGLSTFHNENGNFIPQAATDPILVGQSSAVFGRASGKTITFQSQLRYNTVIGKGKLSLQLVANMQSAKNRGATIDAFGFPNDALLKSFNNATTKEVTEGVSQYKYVSGAAIINYNWDNKYIINLNGNRDGSSRFGPGKQFGNFGSIGLAWNISDEKWMQKIMPSWFSFLKFRGSYGTTGSDAIGDYEYLSRWSKSLALTGTRNLFRYNGQDVFHVVRPLNQEFQWESNIKSEIAVTMAFLQNRITFSLSAYRNISSNQLTDLDIPRFTGFPTALTNWEARIANSGIDVMLGAGLIEEEEWGLNVNFNIGRNINKLIGFPNIELSPYRDRFRVGQSLSTTYLLKFTGIDPLTGNATAEDRNKDGKITYGSQVPTLPTDDRYIVKDLAPKYAGGFGMGLRYKGLSVHTQFSFVNRIIADPYLATLPGSRTNIILPDEIKNNHWQQPGDQAKYPRYSTNSNPITHLRASDANYVNGSYLRMSNLSLSYQLPQKWISKIKMKGAYFSIQTQNLFTIWPYRGIDPTFGSALDVTPVARTIASNLSFNF